MGPPRITFGIIVFNGEPFTRYCLRSLYPFAHEIIVVEGATQAAAGVATQSGHSTDGTLESLRRFKAEKDPEGKLQIVAREGFWSEKDEQSRAYAERATGDYLWQVDIDEFYRAEDMAAVLDMLHKDPQITAVSFKQVTFWGGFDYLVDGWYLRRGAATYHRLFRWGEGYRYVTHRPPTVEDGDGRNVRELRCISGREMARRGILLYHYSLLFPKQVIEKCEYYGNAPWAGRDRAQQWARQVYLELKNPYRVHNVYEYPSWLLRFTGEHPSQIHALRDDINAETVKVATRPTDDVERLLKSPAYRVGRAVLKMSGPCDAILRKARHTWGRRVVRVLKDPVGSLAALFKKGAGFCGRSS